MVKRAKRTPLAERVDVAERVEDLIPEAPEPEIVTRRPTQALARLDPQALIQKAIETGAGVETMERLVTLAKDVRAVQAREAWYEAMAEFQRTCPSIKKTKTAKILKRDGTLGYEYKYAPLDEILSIIQPIMGPLGLSVSWRQRFETDKVIVSCRISHTLGHHEESGDIAMPVQIANAEVGANPMQRVGIATTYAKRYTLLSIIGMAPEDDTDAATAPRTAAAGGQAAASGSPGAATGDDRPITEPQQKRLWAIAREQLWDQDDVKHLLTGFGVAHTREIPQSQYDAIIQKIKAERKSVPTGSTPQQGTLA